MPKILSLVDRLRRGTPRRREPETPPQVIPLPRPAAERMPTARPFDPEWDDPRKTANHAPERR